MTVSQVPSDCDFTCDSIEVREINSQLEGGVYDSFFVAQRDGEITDLYGMFGIVPYNEREVYPVGHMLP